MEPVMKKYGTGSKPQVDKDDPQGIDTKKVAENGPCSNPRCLLGTVHSGPCST
jgi:hypothetical protein